MTKKNQEENKEQKKDVKIDAGQLLNVGKKMLSGAASFMKMTWFFTIIFFFIVLGFSVWTWWDCIQNPEPSGEVVESLNQEQEKFQEKREKIDIVIEKLKNRKDRFENTPDHQLDRKIFKSKNEIFEEMNPPAETESEEEDSTTSSDGINLVQ